MILAEYKVNQYNSKSNTYSLINIKTKEILIIPCMRHPSRAISLVGTTIKLETGK